MFEIGDIVRIKTFVYGSHFYKRHGRIMEMTCDLLVLKLQNQTGHMVIRKTECELIRKGHGNSAV